MGLLYISSFREFISELLKFIINNMNLMVIYLKFLRIIKQILLSIITLSKFPLTMIYIILVKVILFIRNMYTNQIIKKYYYRVLNTRILDAYLTLWKKLRYNNRDSYIYILWYHLKY